MRAINHCVEAIYSVKASPESDAVAEKGLRELLPALLRCKADPYDLPARLSCQLGGLDLMKSLALRTALRGSRGIEQQLGPLGVPHGETSYITPPPVINYNARVNADKQAKVLDTIRSNVGVATVLEGRGLKKGRSDMGDVLDAIIRELGLLRALTDVGVGRDQLDSVAKHCSKSLLCQSNPILLTDKQQIMQILEMME